MYIASKSRSGGVKNRRKSSSGGVLGGLGASWGAVARFWCVFCETLGRTWAHHGPSWSQVDNKLRPRRAMISARPGKPLIPPDSSTQWGHIWGQRRYIILHSYSRNGITPARRRGKWVKNLTFCVLKKREKQKRSRRIQRACI